ncbi:ChrR family anti-sigma-E factor [Novosphingobium sp. UBA1939]|uniref:ChrR family anti-sigma-E factor n=1 Tax=Novosphingobium sp. UBA1939 TaxID=1946982 RepID=UPI0025FF6CB6|nr:ChrR family anti-sigma-E factor [Novosphingobium sp. UBA1939]
MTPHHHPSDETLLRQAAGTLNAGPALVVAVHLEGCASCRSRLTMLEAVGGALLQNLPPARLAGDALGKTLARLDLAAPVASPTVTSGQSDVGIALPRAMRDCAVGPWRWLGPGLRWSKVGIVGNPTAKVMLIKGRAGRRLPSHGHSGMEYVQILSGSLWDDRGHYRPGDLDEAGWEVDHQPVVGADGDCICLAAVEGDTRLHGTMGRLLRPLVGF